MTSFARIFSPLTAQPPADVVAKLVPGARVQSEPGPMGWRSIRLEVGGVDLRLVETGLADGSALIAQTTAMKKAIVERTPNGPTVPSFRLHRFAGRARHVIEIEGFQMDVPAHQSFALDLARLVYGVVQVPSGFLDSEGRWIVDGSGGTDAGAEPRPVAQAVARRKKTIAALAASNVRIPENLALVESEQEAITCRPIDAKLRALALWRTFRQTCGAPEIAVERDATVSARVEKELTKRERETLAAADKSFGGMGVESLWALLFVLGAIPSLGPLALDCRAEDAMSALDRLTGRGALDGGSLRSMSEILDALDQYQCLAWALADTKGALPVPMKGYVVQMRLRALRWTVLDQFSAWDQVSSSA